MLTAAAALVFLVGGTWRVPRALADRQKRPLCLALLLFGVGAVFDTSPIFGDFDRAVGVTNLSDFLAHALGLIGVYFLMTALDGLVASRSDEASLTSGRWLTFSLPIAVAASAVLFFVTPMPVETASFTAYYGDRATIVAFWSISVAFPVLCLIRLARTIATHWSSRSPTLRYGLRVASLGVALGFAYAGLKLAELVEAGRGHDLAAQVHTLDRVLLGLGLLLIAAGLALPSLAGLRHSYELRRSLRKLDWIWTKFCIEAQAAPVITFGSPEVLLLRRVVEVRDAQAVLWSQLSAEDVEQVRMSLRLKFGEEPPGSEVEAAALAVALRRELDGATPAATLVPAPVALVTAVGGGLDLAAEVRDLTQLSAGVRRALA
jgi:hypothetical protein